MRRASTCLALLGLIALAAPSFATAEITAGIKTFKAKAVPIPGVPKSQSLTGNFYGKGADVEAEYEFEGTGYGANPKNPAGGIPPLSGVNFYLPKGTKLNYAPFKTCAKELLESMGPIACPPGSTASPKGSALGEVTFGETRVPEEATLQAFFAPAKSLLFYTNGTEPVSLQIVSEGKYVSSSGKYSFELKTLVPVVKGPPGAAYASVKQIKIKAGAAIKKNGKWMSYGTLPKKGQCPKGGFPVKTEVFFGGEEGGTEEFGIPKKEVTAEFHAPCPKH
jgi:hypothetical protein